MSKLKNPKKDAACRVNPAYDLVPRHAKTEKIPKRMPNAGSRVS